MSWRIAKALDVLLGELNAAAPQRNKASDGGIGDARHTNKTSDHNPCACCQLVTARDFTHDPKGGLDGQRLADWLQTQASAGNTRIKYVIWRRQIMSGPGRLHPCAAWRPYKGKNAHTRHVHLSVVHERAEDPTPWGWPPT